MLFFGHGQLFSVFYLLWFNNLFYVCYMLINSGRQDSYVSTNMYMWNKCCSFDFSVHHKILKKGIIEQEKSFKFYIINFP